MAKVSTDQYHADKLTAAVAKKFAEAYRTPDTLPPGAIVRDLEALRTAHAFAHLGGKASGGAGSGAAREMLEGIRARTMAQIPAGEVKTYLNWEAAARMFYVLSGTLAPIFWARANLLSWTCREPDGPLPARAWESTDHLVLSMTRLSVEASHHPVRPWLHKVVVGYLKPADLVAYPLDPRLHVGGQGGRYGRWLDALAPLARESARDA